MQRYREVPQGSDPESAELKITSIEGDDKPVYEDAARFLGECAEVSFWGVSVSASGNLRGNFSDSRHGGFLGSGTPMSKEAFEKLEQMLDELPSDGGRLPPQGHRLVVQVFRSGQARVWIYDRANLPDPVLTILRLTDARVRVLTPSFTPTKIWTPEEAPSLSLPPFNPKTRGGTVSPDGSIRVTHDFVCHCLTIYPAEGDKELHVIHAFWQDSWGEGEGFQTRLSFSPDGRYLLVRWGLETGAVLYDTETWQVVKDPKRFPQDLVEYFPSSDWRLGLALTATGEYLVWDEENHRFLSKLDGLYVPPDGLLSYMQVTAFSNDGRQLAVYSPPDEKHKPRLTLWDARDGRFVRELWPVEWASSVTGNPMWWNDGRWLLANWHSQGGEGGMGIWDSATGRFLGTLVVTACQTFGKSTISRGSLLQPCYGPQGVPGPALEWTIAGVQAQVDLANLNEYR